MTWVGLACVPFSQGWRPGRLSIAASRLAGADPEIPTMSAPIVECGSCGEALNVRDMLPGGLAKCGRCGATTDVGAALPVKGFPFLGLLSLAVGVVAAPGAFLKVNPLNYALGPF